MISKRFLVALLMLAVGGLAVPAATAQPLGRALAAGKVDRSHGLKVSAQILPASDKQPPRLSIVAEIPAGWHIYSITQKPGGPKRTIIQLPESTQFRLAGALAATPGPTVEREKYKDIWPDLDVEEHVGRVTWTAPLELSNGVDVNALAIEGHMKAFMCSEQCVDVTLPFVARISPAGSMASVGGMATAWSALVMAAPAAGETIAAPPAPKDDAPVARPVQVASPKPTELRLATAYITITGQLDREVLAPGETATLMFNFEPRKGWHIYPLGNLIPLSGGWPTRIVVEDAAGLEIGSPTAINANLKQKPGAEGGVEQYYQGAVQITLPIRVAKGTGPGTYNVTGAIGYQTCEKTCKQPTGARFMVPVTVGPAAKPGSVGVLLASASFPPTTKEKDPQESVVMTNAALPNHLAAPVTLDEKFAVAPYGGAGHAGAYGFGFDLLLAFLGGLLLNAMPCVLPVIGLKVMSFVQQAGQNRRRIFTLNLWFALGMLSVFLVWASLIAFFSLSASAQFQKPAFSIALAAITFAFALSLLGIWEIPLPGFVGSSSTQSVGEREGATGAVAKGVLSTILATPCVGPLIGGTIDWTIGSGSTMRIFAIYGAMGFGMAAPYLLIGANPALLRWLPKPGLWMETFKQLMGFLLLATVVWLFSSLPSHYFVASLALLFGVWMACWWIGRTPLTAEFAQKLRTWTVAAVIVVGVSWLSFQTLLGDPPAAPGQTVVASNAVWRPFSVEALQKARAEGKTVLIDFTASWCATCKFNKPVALRRQATEDYMREHGIIGLVADKTVDAPEIDDLMKRLDHPSGLIPFYAVFPGNGGPVITYKEGPLWQSLLLDMLKQAGPSRMASKPASRL
ncbi:MAG: thioredoxin family protein [Planctomycetes bacterium]|nr:thioredoxin family protein [Planctomycetota bacterium]